MIVHNSWVGVGPSFLGLGLAVTSLRHLLAPGVGPSRGEGWHFLFGFGVGASCWVGPSFSWVGVGPSFSWVEVRPSSGLELALCGGVGPSFFGLVLLVGLAFPLGVEGWPFLLAVGVAPWGWGWPFLLLGGRWPFLVLQL